jgi:hypothetical protein
MKLLDIKILANKYDRLGKFKEADALDMLLRKMANAEDPLATADENRPYTDMRELLNHVDYVSQGIDVVKKKVENMSDDQGPPEIDQIWGVLADASRSLQTAVSLAMSLEEQ